MFFLTFDFESDLFSEAVVGPGWGVDRPEMLASEALPLRAGAAISSFFAAVVALGLEAGLVAGFCGVGLYLVVLRYRWISLQL